MGCRQGAVGQVAGVLVIVPGQDHAAPDSAEGGSEEVGCGGLGGPALDVYDDGGAVAGQSLLDGGVKAACVPFSRTGSEGQAQGIVDCSLPSSPGRGQELSAGLCARREGLRRRYRMLFVQQCRHVFVDVRHPA
ncbi:hypothetical protein ACFFX0_25300 [Citricoccus parietis]|uniref:Uncharacterized protein n=1 Tax=Citricoccus parietis TaxID=592307 RepID=A0ABV5G5V4_9MICC